MSSTASQPQRSSIDGGILEDHHQSLLKLITDQQLSEEDFDQKLPQATQEIRRNSNARSITKTNRYSSSGITQNSTRYNANNKVTLRPNLSPIYLSHNYAKVNAVLIEE